MKLRNFGALALVVSISAIPSVGAEAAPAFSRCGSAVWFADSNGLTASGEQNEPGAFAAAHRKLPFGTKVRVDNLGNGRSVVVRVNDRGPSGAGRIISVSSAAADELGMKAEGVAEVRLTLVDGDNPSDEACSAEATSFEARAEVPAGSGETALPPVVVSYAESDVPDDLGRPVFDDVSDAPISERFVVAFQDEATARILPLKRALVAAALFAAPPYAKWPARMAPFSANLLLFSSSSAQSWPILDELGATNAAPAAGSTP